MIRPPLRGLIQIRDYFHSNTETKESIYTQLSQLKNFFSFPLFISLLLLLTKNKYFKKNSFSHNHLFHSIIIRTFSKLNYSMFCFKGCIIIQWKSHKIKLWNGKWFSSNEKQIWKSAMNGGKFSASTRFHTQRQTDDGRVLISEEDLRETQNGNGKFSVNEENLT